jgi:hypothetical protein
VRVDKKENMREDSAGFFFSAQAICFQVVHLPIYLKTNMDLRRSTNKLPHEHLLIALKNV